VTLLKERGVALSEVKIKELSFPNMAAALTTGAVEGAYIIEPFLSEVVRKGVAVDVSNPGDTAGSGAARVFGGLKAGQLVWLGSVTPPIWLDGPCEVVAEFDLLGSARLRFV
jgi:hypothetical protein